MASTEVSNEITPALLDWRQGSAYIGVRRTTFFGLIKDKELKAVRIGKRVLVPRDELDAFIDRLRETGKVELSRRPRNGSDQRDAANATQASPRNAEQERGGRSKKHEGRVQ